MFMNKIQKIFSKCSKRPNFILATLQIHPHKIIKSFQHPRRLRFQIRVEHWVLLRWFLLLASSGDYSEFLRGSSCLLISCWCFQIDMTFFPFDTQECVMKFGSWSYTKNYLNIMINSPTNAIVGGGQKGEILIDPAQYIKSTEWEIIGKGSGRE